MRNHPRASRWEALGTIRAVQGFAACFLATAATRASRPVCARLFRAVRRALVDTVGCDGRAVGRPQLRRGQHNAVAVSATGGASARIAKGAHGSQRLEGAMVGTVILVDRHGILRMAGTPADRRGKTYVADHRSGASGISIEPSRYFFGPSALGIMSHSKISVGNQRVAQALGISTTPEICPCTGAVPRMA